MVTTSRPAAPLIGVTQLRVAAPSRCTVHAPQSPMPQPYFVPVSRSSSRRYQRSGISGSPSKCRTRPLTVSWIIASTAAAQAVLFGGVALLEAAVEVATVEAPVLTSHQIERALPPALLRGLGVEERDFPQRREKGKESHDPRAFHRAHRRLPAARRPRLHGAPAASTWRCSSSRVARRPSWKAARTVATVRSVAVSTNPATIPSAVIIAVLPRWQPGAARVPAGRPRGRRCWDPRRSVPFKSETWKRKLPPPNGGRHVGTCADTSTVGARPFRRAEPSSIGPRGSASDRWATRSLAASRGAAAFYRTTRRATTA